MTTTVRLDRLLTGTGARITVKLGPDGAVSDAWFVLDDLPRAENFLHGRPVAGIPTLIEHLCSICPVAHHLAGAQALDTLTEAQPITPTAEAVRRLLHHGDVLHTHARQLMEIDSNRALTLQSFARQVISAAAGPGHFPQCAVPGGVAAAVTGADRDALADEVGQAIEVAVDLEVQSRTSAGSGGLQVFAGYDVALSDEDGRLDLYGARLRAVPSHETTAGEPTFTAAPHEWTDIVAEARIGATASRPFLRALGPQRGSYRVGPIAQLRVGELTTAHAESARVRWIAAGGGAKWARAIIALHASEIVAGLLRRPDLVAGPLVAPTAAPIGQPLESGTVATGWVDGARGLLVHTYRVGAEGNLLDACISTPTAQKERWLATLLKAAVEAHPIGAGTDVSRPPPGLVEAMEAAVRHADPCLPCTSLPAGRMGLVVSVLDADGSPIARWEPPDQMSRTRSADIEAGGED